MGRAHGRDDARGRAGRATPTHVDQRAWLWQALQELPVRQRAAIVLRYYEDLTEAQTADAMGCAVGTGEEPGLRPGSASSRDRLGADVLPTDLIEVTR